MFRYTVQRLIAAVPILLGVLLVTFALFHCTAGDPAALMVGKNASARELENIRSGLRLDRPLFAGHWRRTELFRELVFADGPQEWHGLPGVDWARDGDGDGAIRLLPGAEARLLRQWQETAPAARFRLGIHFRGTLRVNDAVFHHGAWRWLRLPVTPDVERVTLAGAGLGAEVRAVRAQRWQEHALDSQFVAALRELADVQRDPESGRLRVSFLNFGSTLLTREPIRDVLLAGLGPSLALMLPVFVVELVLAVGFAMVSAYWRGTILDRTLVVLSVAGMSVSYLVMILAGQYVLAYRMNLFPVWGFESWRHLLLPVIVGVVSGLGGSVRFYRSVFLNEMYQEHVRTARAKGCSPARILVGHVLPNALIPIITRVTVVLPFLFTGSLLLESFFGIPGLGYAGITALANADLQLLKALVLVGSFLFVCANIAADIGYAMVDPRVKLR